MNRRTFVRPEAQADVREAARWYEGRETGLGTRFVAQIRTTLLQIADNPLRFPNVSEDVRRALLQKSTCLSVYNRRSSAALHWRSAKPARHEILIVEREIERGHFLKE